MDPSAVGAIGFSLVAVLATVVMTVLIIVVTIVSIAVPFWLIWKVSQQAETRRLKLMQDGLVAEATVVSASETGMYVNQRPMVRIVLDVRPTGGEGFQAKVDRLISVLEVPRIQPGSAVEVRYEAANRSNLIISSF
jgi:hypothetical protein